MTYEEIKKDEQLSEFSNVLRFENRSKKSNRAAQKSSSSRTGIH